MFGAVAEPLAWDRWPETRELLGPEADEIGGLQDGTATLWVLLGDRVEAAAVTELFDTPKGRECFFRLMAGGDRADWLPCLDVIEAWAVKQGCTAMELNGRPGWERVLKGWGKLSVVMRREIGE